MLKTLNTLSENIRAQSTELLNKHLAPAIDLLAQAKHWNVRSDGTLPICSPKYHEGSTSSSGSSSRMSRQD